MCRYGIVPFQNFFILLNDVILPNDWQTNNRDSHAKIITPSHPIKWSGDFRHSPRVVRW